MLLPIVQHDSGLIFNDITKLRGEGETERELESLVLHHPMLSKICFHMLVLCKVGALLSWVYTLTSCKNSFTMSTAASLITTFGHVKSLDKGGTRVFR